MKDYFDCLKMALLNFCDFDSLEMKEIQSCFAERKVNKNEIFLQAGAVCNKIFFVAKGLVRSFHLNPNGSEFTRVFVREGQFCTVLVSFNEHLKSPAYFQALEDSILLEIGEADFRKLVEKYLKLKTIYLKILEDYQNFQIRRIEFLTQLTPKEKVKMFHSENRELAPRLSKKLIASYLQITPETYSRNVKFRSE